MQKCPDAHIALFGCLLTQLIFRSTPCARASDIIDNGESNIMLLHHPLARHYFNFEIDFLGQQSTILGNHHVVSADKATPISNIDKEIHRLSFLEKSLHMELDYMRRLTKMMDNPDEFLFPHATEPSPSSESCSDEEFGNMSEKKKMFRETQERLMITKVLSAATWPTLSAPRSSKIKSSHPKTEEIHDSIDYDWLATHGFARTYRKLNCHDHAYDQEKPIYTPDMWRKLWKSFQKSTLFPFPIPDADEITIEPYYVAYADGKGRGNFASKNITKGSLIHSGHPNTVFFLEGKSWYRFVSTLPREMACDVMEWAWQQDLTNFGNVVLCLNLDESVFFNDGEGSCNMKMKETTSLDFYASRDIEIGEELVYDYGHFEFDTYEMNV